MNGAKAPLIFKNSTFHCDKIKIIIMYYKYYKNNVLHTSYLLGSVQMYMNV